MWHIFCTGSVSLLAGTTDITTFYCLDILSRLYLYVYNLSVEISLLRWWKTSEISAYNYSNFLQVIIRNTARTQLQKSKPHARNRSGCGWALRFCGCGWTAEPLAIPTDKACYTGGWNGEPTPQRNKMQELMSVLLFYVSTSVFTFIPFLEKRFVKTKLRKSEKMNFFQCTSCTEELCTSNYYY